MGQVGQPLSAIDWLNQETTTPFQQVNPADLEAPIARTIQTEEIAVTELGAVETSPAGLIPLEIVGLSRTLWATVDTQTASSLLDELPENMYPATRSLLYRILLAQAPSSQEILDLRLKTLLRFGAVEAAYKIFETNKPESKEGFEIFFETALLMWEVTEACRLLEDNPGLTTKAAIQIYCTARIGNWDTAVLQYFTHDTLGDIPRPLTQLLGGFLDPGLAEDLELPPVNAKAISPLEFRLRESVGSAVPTTGLPLKFVVTDLQSAAGWRSQIEAAERLTASGALPGAKLFEIYGLNKAAASGGVWERVRLVASFQNAIGANDTIAMASLLPDLARQMKSAGLLFAMATHFMEDLQFVTFPNADDDILRRKLIWLAGNLDGTEPPVPEALLKEVQGRDLENLLRLSFSETVSPRPADAVEILRTLVIASKAQQGDLNALQQALLGLRSLGFEKEATQFAIEYLTSRDAL